jgi:3-oxoacyl-[acyl-carrier protein] reductase
MDLGLKGQVALITGGSKGIGRQTALHFAREGVACALVARDEAGLAGAHDWIRGQVDDADIFTVSADLSAEVNAQAAVARAVAHFGAIDILVNCAGAAPGRVLMDIDDELWNVALGVKFLGYMRMTKSVIPHFLAQGHGVIVNVVGNDGIKPSYWELTGTAANAADLAVMQALADQYGRHNIRINNVNPGPVDTGRWAQLTQAFARDLGFDVATADHRAKRSLMLGRIARPQEVADVVVFLASPRASFVHGASITIDGNQRKALMDRTEDDVW